MTVIFSEPSVAEEMYANQITSTEQVLSEVLADVMGIEQVLVDSHFFDELGADLIVMARFCARLRKQTDLPIVPIKEVRAHPTIRSLAAVLTEVTPTHKTEQVLSEVLVDVMGIEQVSVDSHFFDELGADWMFMARFCARLRKQTDLPTVSIKAVYQHPTISRLAAVLTEDTPTNKTEQLLSEVLAAVMSVEQVSVDSHFFDELGADSMLMARFCARLRKQTDLPTVSIKQVYQHPSIRSLAAVLTVDPATSTTEQILSEALTADSPTSKTEQVLSEALTADSPTSKTEQVLSEVLAAVMSVEQVSVDSHFFDELGADSMLMARFCARLRKQTDLPTVSIKQVYQHPSIRSLAAALTEDSSSSTTEQILSEVLPADSPTHKTEQVLSEVLAAVMSVEQVSVDSHFFDELGADSMLMARFCARLRKQTDLPTVSIKQVYGHPSIRSLAAVLTEESPTPTTEQVLSEVLTVDSPTHKTEQVLSEVLAAVMSVEQVSVDSHFFDELGADSMLMARFCARLRKQTDLPTVSIKQVYAHPSIRSLAATLTDDAPTSKTEPVLSEVLSDDTPAPVPIATSNSRSTKAAAPVSNDVAEPIGKPRFFLCGVLQFLTIFAYMFVTIEIIELALLWIIASSGFVEIFLRTVLSASGLFLFTSCLPILMKWLLIGRWKPQQIRIWSLEYYRFWVVKYFIRLNPMIVFVGSPLYVLYLRALGAKIGRGVLILSPQVPVCTDLLTIGDNTVIRKDSIFNGYRAHDGIIQTGRVTIGSNAYVGEMTVLDIETSLGNDAQLGHSSSLTVGQSIPDGEHRCGAPARQRTEVDYRVPAPMDSSSRRRIVYSIAQLLNLFILSAIIPSVIILLGPQIFNRPYFDGTASPFSYTAFYVDAVLLTILFLFGGILVRLVLAATLPRILNRKIEPDKAYPLYGVHYWAHQTIANLTNIKFFNVLFGDSSYIVNYLRWIGYDLSEGVVQTGSNFGSSVKHDNPFLVSIGKGTMIADGLSNINADYSNTSFQVSQTTIGANNFLGNHIAYPSQGKTGDNCLLATKVMVPLDGEVREGIGLLGSPTFEIPRSVARDIALDHPKSEAELAQRLAAKNKHNLVTIGLFLLGQWVYAFVFLLLMFAAADAYNTIGHLVFVLAAYIGFVSRPFYHILLERISLWGQSLRPRQCSIYNPYFWFHERYWKMSVLPQHLGILNGTPLKGFAWRLLGVQVGKRLFDDGCLIVEKTMVTVGDNCTFNQGSLIQPHSQEDGGFKSDYIAIGNNCTIGVDSLVHYGATMGDGAQLDSGSFLMKGQEVPPNTHWGENPAMEIEAVDYAEVAKTSKVPLYQEVGSIATTLNGGTRREAELKPDYVSGGSKAFMRHK